jgi:hypothetical protein
VAGGQSALLLRDVPAGARAATESAVHLSAVSGVQSTLAVSGAVGILAGLLVAVLVRPPAVTAVLEQAEPAAGRVPEARAADPQRAS